MWTRWNRVYVWFIFLSVLSLFACAHNSCGYTAQGIFEAVVDLPAYPFEVMKYKMDYRSEQAMNTLRINEFANKNKDEIIDMSEAKNILENLYYSDEQVRAVITDARMYAFAENKKSDFRTPPIAKKKKNKVLILLSHAAFQKVVEQKKEEDQIVSQRYADKNSDGKVDTDEAKIFLFELGFDKGSIGASFARIAQKSFEIRLYTSVEGYHVSEQWKNGKMMETAYIAIQWQCVEKLLREKFKK